ncbi:MAG: glycosyl hydrolase, partial [Acidobacteriota bacterium]|nr:glycosyl hydrolase [Acidobacteriota bacterium]
MRSRSLVLSVFAIAGAAILSLAQSEGDRAPAGEPAFRGLRYRLIGPFRGGRSLAVAGIPGDPATYYFGAAGGGVWKTTDGAVTWAPVFDHETAFSIGAIAVAASDHNVIWAGTGETALRGDIAQGDGVYKSTDAGKTWTNMGLHDSRAIGRILIHPRNPEIVLVAALGHAFGPNAERGVFRTTDGGKTWDKVLYKDENTGAVDLCFDPANPNIVFAALWQARRTSWSLESGGPGSGLYRSSDGGATWKQVQGGGLPKGPWGKTGIAVGADGERVYALVEAKEGGLFRSDNGGTSWRLVNPNRALVQRAFYYMHIFADPKSPDVVYVLNVEFSKSIDGGRTFTRIRPPHGDNHALWIDPVNTERMIEGNDGGATVTLDGGKHWSSILNQPTAQFYHVITDHRVPYFVYGAQQDNTTVAIASRGDSGSIDRPEWYPAGGGESGYIAPDPRDPNIVYAGGYEGSLTRFDKRTGQTRQISPWPDITDGEGAAKLKHRFQWTAPTVISPHDPNVLYHGGECLFRTTDGGTHWDAISPDLTRNDKSKQAVSGGPIDLDDTGTEYYDTIFTIAES